VKIVCDCKNCLRNYDWTDQCEVPACGIPYKENEQYIKNTPENFNKRCDDKDIKLLSDLDIEGYKFIRNNAHWIHFTDETGTMVLGHSYDLNKNGDCYFYKTLPYCFIWVLRTRQFLNKIWFKLFLKFN
jgi:hypothetical protein